jgi:hypothetical protein
MHWLGVSPKGLSKNHLLPDKNDDRIIQEAAHVLSRAIHDALSSRVKTRAAEISERIFLQVITILKLNMIFFVWSSSIVIRISTFKVYMQEYQGSNPGPCIFHAMSLPTELCSRGQIKYDFIKRLTSSYILSLKKSFILLVNHISLCLKHALVIY